MSIEIAIALIAAVPPTLAAILGFNGQQALAQTLDWLQSGIAPRQRHASDGNEDRPHRRKGGRLAEGQAQVRERLARLEGGERTKPVEPATVTS